MEKEFRCFVCWLPVDATRTPIPDVCDRPDCVDIARSYEDDVVVYPVAGRAQLELVP